ncbi:MAG: YdeI/OmpD-associated family protein [Solirubrobacterales bacterium]
MSEDRPEVHVDSAAELRAWLESNHDASDGVWLVTHKKTSVSGTYVSWTEIVDELIAFGWVDSVQKRLDEDRSKIQITPRKAKSKWSRVNKERVERLIAEGRMEAPGMAMVELAKETGTWTALDAVERLEEPDDLRAALDAVPEARRHYDAFPPSSRRAILEWVTSAKRPATREGRIAETVTLAAEDLRASDWPRPKPGDGKKKAS